MSAAAIQNIYTLAVGFACAGFLSTGYQLAMQRPASFYLLNAGPRPSTFAAIPFLIFAAPFIIVRGTLCGGASPQRRFERAMAAAIIAGFWSLMSGTVVVSALAAVQS